MAKELKLYRLPSAMEPLHPEDAKGELHGLASELVRKASALSRAIHPNTRAAIAAFVRPMNSYYSNLIEGHDTHPLDIERALNSEFSNDKKKRDLQLEAKAHIALLKKLPETWNANTDEHLSPYETNHILDLHKRFYEELPDSFLTVVSKEGLEKKVVPGKVRGEEVQVGNHIAPAADCLSDFMHRFSERYDPAMSSNKALNTRIINIAASHHRLAWIHPFLDGNGRVVRLMSDAGFMKEGLDASGLWSVSRGLARKNKDYYGKLANADMQRHGDYDGRGNLSDKMLREFCRFFLTVAIDQVEFMTACLDIDTLIQRVDAFVNVMSVRKNWRPEIAHILTDIYLKGKLSKANAMRITNTSDKTLKSMTDMLMKEGLIKSVKDGKEMTYRAQFPVRYSPFLFPGLYPAAKESDLMMSIFEK